MLNEYSHQNYFNKLFALTMSETIKSASSSNAVISSIPVEKFLGNAELNFLSFIYSSYINDNIYTQRAKIEELSSLSQKYDELENEMNVNTVYDDGTTNNGISFKYLKASILNNIFTMCYCFKHSFHEQENFCFIVAMKNFEKLKYIVKTLFESEILTEKSNCWKHSLYYEITRLFDFYLDAHQGHPKVSDDYVHMLLEEGRLDTVDYARSQYIEFLVNSNYPILTNAVVKVPSVFHLLICQSPSGLLFFKNYPYMTNELLMLDGKQGTFVSLSNMNVLFLCIYKHRIAILKTILKADYKKARKNKKDLLFNISSEFELRFNNTNLPENFTNNGKKTLSGGLKYMTILTFARLSNFGPKMMNLLIENIVDSYRDVKHYYEADDDIKDILIKMIMDQYIYSVIEMLEMSLYTFSNLAENPEIDTNSMSQILPSFEFFDLIFNLKLIKGSIYFHDFNPEDVIIFATDRVIENFRHADGVNTWNPCFLQAVVLQFFYNLCFYIVDSSTKFIEMFSKFYLDSLLQEMKIFVEKMFEFGFCSKSFVLFCKTAALCLVSRYRGYSFEDKFLGFYDYFVRKSNEKEEKEIKEKMEKVENEKMFEERFLMEKEMFESIKIEKSLFLQEKKRLEEKRKKDEQERKKQEMERKKEEMQEKKKKELEYLLKQKEDLINIYLNDEILSTFEKETFLKKFKKVNFEDLVLEIEKKKSEKTQKKLNEEEKKKLREKSKEEENLLKQEFVQLQNDFNEFVEVNHFENNVKVKVLKEKNSKLNIKLFEKCQNLRSFMSSTKNELLRLKENLEEETKQAAKEAKIAVEELEMYFQESVKKLETNTISFSGTNIVLPISGQVESFKEMKMKPYLENLFEEKYEDIELSFLEILNASNIEDMFSVLISNFNVDGFHTKYENEKVEMSNFIGKVLIIMSFLANKVKERTDYILLLKGSMALSSYIKVKTLDVDFVVIPKGRHVDFNISLYEEVSVCICYFLREILMKHYERALLLLEFSDQKNENGYANILKMKLNSIVDKVQCSYYNKTTKKVTGLSFMDVNFASKPVKDYSQILKPRYYLQFNKETKMLRKVEDGNKLRLQGNKKNMFGIFQLPSLRSLLEERLYYLVYYTEVKNKLIVNMEETTRDPIMFYVKKTLTQIKDIVEEGKISKETIAGIYESLRVTETEFPVISKVRIFDHLLN
jgi:hypothetical protein